MTLDGFQSVGGFNRPVLSRVAGKDDAGMVLPGESQEFHHLTAPDLPRLVHHNCGVGRKLSLLQERRDRGRGREPSRLHVHHLLTLRREHDHRPTALPNLLDQFAKCEALPCSCAAAEQCYSVGGSE